MQFQFEHPELLFLLWLVPVMVLVLVMVFRRSERRLDNFISVVMRSRLCPPSGKGRFIAQVALLALALSLMLIAIARPRWGMRDERVFQRGRDLVLVVDVSLSMLARDVHPTRLQRAKADLSDLIRELRGDRAALVAFRRKAIQLCPLTADYAFLEYALDSLSPESAPRGETDIGDAIMKALDSFETDSGSHRAIILISDGEDLAGTAMTAAEHAKEQGVTIFSVGLGDSDGARIPTGSGNAFLKYQDNEVVTRLENETLRKLAEITGGAYVPVGVGNVRLGTLYKDHLRKLTAIDSEESIQRRAIERFQLFVLPALLSLFAIAFLSRGRMPLRSRQGAFQQNHSRQSADKRRDNPGSKVSAFRPGGRMAPVAGSAATQKQVRLTGTPPPLPVSRVQHAARTMICFLAFGCALGSAALAGTNEVAETNALLAAGVTSNTGHNVEAGVLNLQGRDAARRAQELYTLGRYEESARTYLNALSGVSTRYQEDCLFNAACALYKAGNYVEAAGRFKELAARSANGTAADADYNLGCAWFQAADRAQQGTNAEADAVAYLDRIEKAGQAFQQSLRFKPDRAAARRNLAVVADVTPEARERLRIARLMARYGNMPPPQIAGELLRNQRSVLDQLASSLTNTTPTRIDQFETIAALQKNNAEIIYPLRAGLLNAIQSQAAQPGATQAVANIQQHLDALGNVMRDAATGLRDLDDSAAERVANAEKGAYLIWRMVADYSGLLQEDMRLQSNAIARTQSSMTNATAHVANTDGIGMDQAEAQTLTHLFSERFIQAFPSNGMAGADNAPQAIPESQGGTNDPPMTPEKRETILSLARDAGSAQVAAGKALSSTNLIGALPHETKALQLLQEIDKLLPRDKQDQDQDKNKDQQQGKDKDQNKQDQNKENEQNQDQEKDQEKDQDSKPEQQPESKPEEQPEQPPPKPEPEKNGEKDKKEMTPEQAQALLDKALQREQERRQEEYRNQYIPPSAIDRDW